jgi:hypothetical protein
MEAGKERTGIRAVAEVSMSDSGTPPGRPSIERTMLEFAVSLPAITMVEFELCENVRAGCTDVTPLSRQRW